MALEGLEAFLALPTWQIYLTIIWIIVWKGLAFWKSARRGSIVWFVAFLVIHTMGLLEILYYFIFSEMSWGIKDKKPKRKVKKKKKRR